MSNEIKHIQKVEISNLFGRFDFEWTLQPDVNVLAGANGSGKSTVLYCLYSLVALGAFNRKEVNLYTDNINMTLNDGHTLRYECENVLASIQDMKQRAKNGNVEAQILLDSLENRTPEDFNNLVGIEASFYRTFFNDVRLNNITDFRNTSLGSMCVDIINTFDTKLKDAESIKRLSNDQVRTELDWEIYNLQKRYLAYQLNLSKKKDIIVENSENPKEDIKKLRQTHNRFLDMLDAMMEESGKKVNREDNEISFLFDDGTPIYPHQLSSGEKQLLIILLTILVQDNKQAILFLDEPEVSLHIEWQKKLIEYMTELNPNLQIILATHSPAIIMEGWFDHTFNMHELIKPKK